METTKKTTAKKAPAKKAVATTADATKITAIKVPAKKVVARKAMVAPVAEVVATPAHEQISQRAYLIWANRGFSNGDPNRDWIQAERELKRA
jgi:hypothetical protein